MKAFIHDWWITIKYTSRLTKNGRMHRQVIKDIDNPDAWVEAPRPRYCTDCPDHEACMTGYPCNIVKKSGTRP